MNRTAIIGGPAFITWNGGTYFTTGDIVCTLGSQRFRIPTSAFGNISSRLSERAVTIAFTPCGEWEADTKTKLFATGAGTSFSSLRIYESIIGATDKNLVITPLNGVKPITFNNACISKLPNLTFRATEVIVGAVEFMALGTNDTDWSVANSLFAIGTDLDPSTDISYAAFSPTAIVTKGYQASWGDGTGSLAGFLAFEGKEGFQVEFNMEAEPFSIDSNGIIDYRFKGLDMKITTIPIGPTETQITTALAIQGSGAARGRQSDSIKADFLIQDGESEATIFTGYNMSLVEAPLVYGQNNRFQQCTWECNRTVSGGALTPVFLIA